MRSVILSLSRLVFCLIALLWAISGYAEEVPRETLDRLADINVEKAELRHLNGIGKLSDPDYNSQHKALEQEAAALWAQQGSASREEKAAATTTITGLTRTKLSLLEPRWAKEQAEFQQAGRRQQEQTAIALERDARTAADFQRQRLLLQRQLDKGAIDRDTFAAKDREAQNSIAALRKKFEEAGGGWPRRFDEQLTHFTKALADDPDTVLPRSRVPATAEGQGGGRGGPPDFNSDVKLAAELLVNSEDVSWKITLKKGSPDTLGVSARIYNHDLSRLRLRYQALDKLQQFEAAYTRMAAPGIQAVRMKHQPEKYRPPVTVVQKPQPPPEKDYSLWYWIGGGILVLLIIGWASSEQEQQAPPSPPKPSDIHGSAQWAARQVQPAVSRSVQQGVTFGKSSHPETPANANGAPVTSLPESHSLIVARTRAGKGTRVIMPTLLRYRDSMLVIDPKGENAAVTGKIRRDSLGQTVHILNPWGELAQHYASLGFTAATYNPLDALDRNDPNVVAIAQNFAATICPTGNAREPFWPRSAANILAAVLLWITDRPDEQKTFARVRELVTLSRKDFKKSHMSRMVKSTAFDGAIKEMVGQYNGLADETYSGISSHLIESTSFLSDPQIKASTAASSFSMQNLLDEYITVFLVIPHDRIQTHATWLRLVIASATQAIKNRGRTATPRHHRCMFLIDEFGSIGNMPALPQDLVIMAGYGLDFTLIVQGLDQLEHHYGAAKNTILGNCAWKWFCNIGDLETAKYLSQTLGKKTVATVSMSSSTGTSGENPTAGTSTSHGETGRDLLTPDEILNLGREVAILLNPTTAPHYLRPVDYWDLTKAYAYLQKTHPSLYWNPPLSYDDNPYIKSTHLSANPTMKQLEAFFGKIPQGLQPKFPNPSNPSKPFDPKNPFGI